VRRGIGPEHGADRKSREQDILTLANRIGIADAQRRQWRSGDLDERQVGARVDGDRLAVAHLRFVLAVPGLVGQHHRQRFAARDIEHARDHVRIGDDQRAVADGETGAKELELRRARALQRSDRDNRRPNSIDRPEPIRMCNAR
jgi:hypothetical protein